MEKTKGTTSITYKDPRGTVISIIVLTRGTRGSQEGCRTRWWQCLWCGPNIPGQTSSQNCGFWGSRTRAFLSRCSTANSPREQDPHEPSFLVLPNNKMIDVAIRRRFELVRYVMEVSERFEMVSEVLSSELLQLKMSRKRSEDFISKSYSYIHMYRNHQKPNTELHGIAVNSIAYNA